MRYKGSELYIKYIEKGQCSPFSVTIFKGGRKTLKPAFKAERIRLYLSCHPNITGFILTAQLIAMYNYTKQRINIHCNKRGDELDMLQYTVEERHLTVEELTRMRKSVGWSIWDACAMERGLQNSLYCVCAVYSGSVIGCARVVGDGSTCFYIQDVIVDPLHQKQGIGAALIRHVLDYIGENACEKAIVGLMAAKGKEGFYEKFDFWKRPNENAGHGMMQYWKKKES